MNALQRNARISESEKHPLQVRDIQWCSQQRKMHLGQLSIKLTPAEYRLLYPLRHGYPVTYAQLAMVAYGYVIDAKVREMMDKHIDRVRGKLEGSGIYVYSVFRYGYVLLPAISLEEVSLQGAVIL